MQGIRPFDPLSGGVRLELTPSSSTSTLAIDGRESTEMRIQRLVSESPVVVFSRPNCYMCHVMKRLLSTLGVHPTVIELEEEEISALPCAGAATADHHHHHHQEEEDREDSGAGGGGVRHVPGAGDVAPALFVGGARVGGLESLVALHLSGRLVPMLVEVGALIWV